VTACPRTAEGAAGAAGAGARATHVRECVHRRRIGMPIQADALVTMGSGAGAGRQAAVQCTAFSPIRLPVLESTNLRLRGTGGRREGGMPERACPTPPAWMGSASPWCTFSTIRSVCAQRAWPATSKALAPAVPCRALSPSLLSEFPWAPTAHAMAMNGVHGQATRQRCAGTRVALRRRMYHGVRQPRACRRRRSSAAACAHDRTERARQGRCWGCARVVGRARG